MRHAVNGGREQNSIEPDSGTPKLARSLALARATCRRISCSNGTSRPTTLVAWSRRESRGVVDVRQLIQFISSPEHRVCRDPTDCLSAQIEYMVVSFDEETKNARLSLRQSEILKELAQEEMDAIAQMPGAA